MVRIDETGERIPLTVADFDRDRGTVTIVVHRSELGQKVWTALPMIVAEELGIDVEDVKVSYGDTEGGACGAGSFASRATMITGNAILDATKKAREILFRFASQLLEAPPEELEAKDRKVYVKGTDRFCWLADAAFLAYAGRDGGYFTVKGYWDADDSVIPDLEMGKGQQSIAGLFYTAGMEVEVDVETGEVEVINCVAAYDAGKIINPVGAEGQIDGSTAQGMGFAMRENIPLEKGRPMYTNFVKYGMASAMDMPRNVDVKFVETHEKSGPYGAKGIGEPGHVPHAPAIANAIYDAIGVRIYSLPITPEKVLAAMKKAKSS